MLRVSLLGNVGADPEVRYTPRGTMMVTLRVAVNQVRTGPDGERQESTEWFRVRVTNRQAEYVQRLTKGNRVLVMGRLDIGHYTGKDGDARTSFDVWADEVQSVSPRPAGEPWARAGELEPEAEPEAVSEGPPEQAESPRPVARPLAAVGESSSHGASHAPTVTGGSASGRPSANPGHGATRAANGSLGGHAKPARAAPGAGTANAGRAVRDDLDDLPF